MSEGPGSRTAQRLLDATWSVVRDEGLAAATSRRITDAAGANLAAITYHFGSKDALIGAAVVERLRDLTSPLTAALREPDGDIAAHDAAVAAAIADMFARVARDRADVDADVTLLLTSPALPGVRDAAASWLAELRAVATAAMVRQQAAGAVPAAVVPEAMAGVFTALAVGIVAQAKIDAAAPDAGAIVQEFLGLLVRPTP
jgi:AcrR family transcriptional regulator